MVLVKYFKKLFCLVLQVTAEFNNKQRPQDFQPEKRFFSCNEKLPMKYTDCKPFAVIFSVNIGMHE